MELTHDPTPVQPIIPMKDRVNLANATVNVSLQLTAMLRLRLLYG